MSSNCLNQRLGATKCDSASSQNLVIFDCDGVLVDSEHISNQALIDCLSEIKIEMSVDEALLRFKGRNLTECFSEIQTLRNCLLPSSFESTFRQRRRDYFESQLQPIKGIHAAIQKIPHSKCVASNGPEQMIKRNLELTKLSHHFGENIFSAYSIQKWKPDPSLFLHACKKMRSEPRMCVVIEDSEAGVAAALAGGFNVLAFGFKASFCEVVSFETMSELPDLIEQIFTDN